MKTSIRKNFAPEYPIKQFLPISHCDWPGKTSAVFFLGGCNWRCPYCHNYQIAWYPQAHPSIMTQEIEAILDKNIDWLDGFVISGGEPTEYGYLLRMAAILKETYGKPILLDTNGSRPDKIDLGLSQGVFDAVALDIKGPVDKYWELTGHCCDTITAKFILSYNLSFAEVYGNYLIRTTKCPGLTDEEVETVKSYLPPGYTLNVQEYRPVE